MQREQSDGVPWRMILLAGLGGALEFYDFVVFGVFAAGIGAAFFPSADPLVSQMLAFAGFGIGYVARPLGGMVLGHFGDRIGRRRVFVGSVLLVSLATFAMGCVPGYARLGVVAPLLLLALRMVQGFFLGGQLPGAITYVVETVPRRASFVCGVVFACVNGGVLLASLVALVVQQALPDGAAAGWGWRIGFWFGGALGLLGWQLRRALLETPAFAAMQRHVSKSPLREVFASHPGAVLTGIATTAATACFNGLLFVHMPGYLIRVLHYPATQVQVAQTLAVLTLSVALLGVAWLGDRWPWRWLLASGATALLLGAWPWYAAAASGRASPLVLLVAAALAASLATGVFGVVVADLFPTRVRFSGIGFAYNASFTAFSGTAPLLATAAIARSGSLASPALVMATCAVLTLLGSFAFDRYGGCLRSD